jgi:hypothetical protein
VQVSSCEETSELPGRSGYASPHSLRPLSGVEARLSDLFAAERTNSSACAQAFKRWFKERAVVGRS